jgi:hypothetical protein
VIISVDSPEDINDPDCPDEVRQPKKDSKCKTRKKKDRTRAQEELPSQASDDAGDPQTGLISIDLPTNAMT